MKATSDKWQVTSLRSEASARQAGDKRNAATGEARSFYVSRFTFPASGFTLVEIMIAIAIFSIVIAAIYSTWTLILRASQVGQNTAAEAQRQRIALRTMEDSLTCAQSFQASMKYYVFLVQNGDQPELSFTARLPDVFPRNGKFGGFNLRRLTFSVEPGPGSQKNLVLRQQPVLMDMDPDERQTPLVLAHDVNKFAIECWDTSKLDWVDEWDTTNSIPGMVRINLVLGGGTGASSASPGLVVTRIIAMPSSTLPSGLQGNTAGVGTAPPGIGPGTSGRRF